MSDASLDICSKQTEDKWRKGSPVSNGLLTHLQSGFHHIHINILYIGTTPKYPRDSWLRNSKGFSADINKLNSLAKRLGHALEEAYFMSDKHWFVGIC